MSELITGTCNVTPGSQFVTFNGVDISSVSIGDLFKLINDEVFYIISSVDSSSSQITLSTVYSNSSFQNEVTNETIATSDGTNQFSFTLNYHPVIAGSVEISDEDDTETFTDDGAGNLIGDQGGTGTISYQDGVGNVTFNSTITSGKNIIADEYSYGSEMSAVSYQIIKDFTSNFSFPEPYPGINSPNLIIRKALRMIDSELLLATKESLHFHVFDSDTSVSIGDGKKAIVIPGYMNGFEIIDVIASIHTKGVTGSTDIQIRRRRAGSDQDVLSSKITIGDEYYANDGTINSTYKTLQTGDNLYVDVDSVHSGTAPLGLDVAIIVRHS